MPDSDQTTPARIRDAALRCIARNGATSTSLREIGKAAGVSAALIVHHFGSKAGLLRAVDDHAFAAIESMLARVFEGGGGNAGMQAFVREFQANGDLFAYFTRALQDDTGAGAATFERLIRLTATTFAETDAAGLTRSVADPEMRNVVMLAMDMGVMLLAPHVSRYLGIDILSEEGLRRWSEIELDLLCHGVFTEAFLRAGSEEDTEEES